MVLLIAPVLAIAAGWVFADLRAMPRMRRVLGAAMVLMLVASVAYQRIAERFSANAYFTSAAQKLMDESIQGLENGRQDAVLREWRRARQKFGATYENRGAFAEVVAAAVAGMRGQ